MLARRSERVKISFLSRKPYETAFRTGKSDQDVGLRRLRLLLHFFFEFVFHFVDELLLLSAAHGVELGLADAVLLEPSVLQPLRRRLLHIVGEFLHRIVGSGVRR
jgi:hypothetical protein